MGPQISETLTVSASLLNRMTVLDHQAGTVLAADSYMGAIWRINTKSLTYEIVLQGETMTPGFDRRSTIGINGVKVLSHHVYYNNLSKEMFCRVQIDHLTGKPLGPYEVIARAAFADNFAIDSDGTAYLAGLDINVSLKVNPDGNLQTVAGSLYSADLIGAIAAAFGRITMDRNTLYITTGGGIEAPINGTYIEGGKIVAISL